MPDRHVEPEPPHSQHPAGGDASAASTPVPASLPRTGNPATDFSLDFLAQLVQRGVTDLVVCPGSRSQALSLVAAELERVGAVRLHVRIDERSAGFFALGLAAETGRAVPVITTSGTAVANLLPAMLEAFHATVPLVAVTADRPEELLGIGANQATTQPGIFGPNVPHDAVQAPVGAADEVSLAERLAMRAAATRGPLHLNLAFRDPLSVAVPELDAWAAGAATLAPADRVAADQGRAAPGQDEPPASGAETLDIEAAEWPRTLVIAGAAAGPEAEKVAHDGSWPLIAEATSGSRYGRNLVLAYRQLLGPTSPRPDLRDAIERVLVFGHPTLSREIPQLIAHDDVHAVVVGPTGGEPYNPGHAVAAHVDAVRVHPVPTADAHARTESRAWLREWVLASRELMEADAEQTPAPDIEASRSSDTAVRGRFAKQELAVARTKVDRRMLAEAVWSATWPHDRLVLGASTLIRSLDAQVAGKPIRVHANRGLAGIDGTIATTLGVAVGSQLGGPVSAQGGVTRALIGDLTLLHDASSLLIGQGGEWAPRVQLIVGNDGGGTIFDDLEVARTAAAEAHTRVLYTPTRVDLEALATAYGWSYCRAETRADLQGALVSREHERILIEVPLSRG
ncbi:2-succinyl-5-enolpyruvyl-6-hydroxy-3-cyclohexene-1-carboxylic-acid synthase [Pseudoclavibacter sp. Marseille-Q434]|uniref:2-succinyl-5-enolpyruvyl-6-hydroxy-3- cyclohexene-1-carboxylic-acid synthase n=1 Tax=Pseudoclavibacter sp. Marseille-Q434 TaxID=3418996 RepID=UPI0027DC0447|nr:2-succinyl-5-enolpyruvyl-6-hydroxy-3-cyclohexene-1-carboxylic-acid synthase [Pseudoclavibacter sp. Marseille-Q4354]